MIPEHLTPRLSDRGFAFYERTPDRTGQNYIEVHESSSADEACVWIAIGEGDDECASTQFTAAQAVRFAEQILAAVRDHRMAWHVDPDVMAAADARRPRPPAEEAPETFTAYPSEARWPGMCPLCSTPITVGEPIVRSSRKRYVHERCKP